MAELAAPLRSKLRAPLAGELASSRPGLRLPGWSGSRALSLAHRVTVALAALILVAACSLAVFRARYDDRVLPAIVVADVEVGGMTRAEARTALAARVDGLLDAPATFSYEGRTWSTSLRQLGVSADTDGAIEKAFSKGREESARERIDAAYDVAQGGAKIPLALTIDAPSVERWAETVTDELALAPEDATLTVEGAEVIVTPDVAGVIVDSERMTAIVHEAVRSLTPISGMLPTQAKAAEVHTEDLQPEADRITKALSKPITIAYKQKKWKLQPEDIGPFIRLVDNEDGTVRAEIDKDQFADWLRPTVSEALNRDPVDAVLAWSGDGVEVVKGSRDGIRVRPDSLAREINNSFFGDHQRVEIPIRVVKPKVDDDKIDEMNIEQQIGEGSSNFAGSEEGRAINIAVGTELLNGALVEPGGEFSFNDAVGAITEDKGYVEGAVIEAERIGRDIGGGICQVSTTVFRAAYLAGLPFVEWNPHVYRLNFYELDGWPPGLDAAIFQDGPRESWVDLRFTNPTDGWLLIESYVVDTQVTVKIFGPDTGWTVDTRGPEIGKELKAEDEESLELVDETLDPGTVQQAEAPLDGLEVTHVRKVTDAEGDVIDEYTFYTRFASRGYVYKVSPDMVGESPADEQNAARASGGSE